MTADGPGPYGFMMQLKYSIGKLLTWSQHKRSYNVRGKYQDAACGAFITPQLKAKSHFAASSASRTGSPSVRSSNAPSVSAVGLGSSVGSKWSGRQVPPATTDSRAKKNARELVSSPK